MTELTEQQIEQAIAAFGNYAVARPSCNFRGMSRPRKKSSLPYRSSSAAAMPPFSRSRLTRASHIVALLVVRILQRGR